MISALTSDASPGSPAGATRDSVGRLRRRRTAVMVAGAAGLLAVVVMVDLTTGRGAVGLAEIGQVVRGEADPASRQIVMYVRAPRVAVAVLAGALLAVAGGLLQAITRNPLADPGLLGVTPAAVLGAIVALTRTGGSAGTLLLSVGALAGAALGGALVYALGWRRGADPLRFVLTGVIIGGILSAMSSLLLIRSGDSLGAVFRWVIGSLHARTWTEVQIAGAGLATVFVGAILVRRPATLLALGDDVARGRGLSVDIARASVFAVSAVAAAAAAAAVGAVAFLGLVAPHLARRLARAGLGWSLVLSAFIGAVLLVAADVTATTLTIAADLRGAIQRAVVPVGALTAGMGAAFLLTLLRERRQ